MHSKNHVIQNGNIFTEHYHWRKIGHVISCCSDANIVLPQPVLWTNHLRFVKMLVPHPLGFSSFWSFGYNFFIFFLLNCPCWCGHSLLWLYVFFMSGSEAVHVFWWCISALPLDIQLPRGEGGIPLSGLTPPYFCFWPNLGPGLATSLLLLLLFLY